MWTSFPSKLGLETHLRRKPVMDAFLLSSVNSANQLSSLKVVKTAISGGFAFSIQEGVFTM